MGELSTEKAQIFFLSLTLVLMSFFSTPNFCESFGNSGVTIPKVGMAFFDTPLLVRKKDWGIKYQFTLGTSYAQALNYKWWWIAETSFAVGKMHVDDRPYLSSFMGGAGLRYSIFEGDFRPHLGAMIHYLHFMGQDVKKMPLNIEWPIWVGIKPFVGMEWLFYSEMAIILEGAYGIYLNINEPFRQVLYASASFVVYF